MVAEALEVCIEPDPVALRGVRSALRAWLVSVDAGAVDDVVLAVGEAVANAVEHGHADGATVGAAATVLVRAHLTGDTIHVEVRDAGRWRAPVAGTERGRGIAIMRAVMDDVDVQTGAAGTVVAMRRRLA